MKKKFLQIIFFVWFITFTASQVRAQVTQQQHHYDWDFLAVLSKVELTNIYMREVLTLTKAIPYCSFTIKSPVTNDTTSVADAKAPFKIFNIPGTENIKSNRYHISRAAKAYNDALVKYLKDIIPYSEKPDLIKGILYMQDMIDKLDAGFIPLD